MIAHPDIDPTAFAVFGWPVRWYGLMYLLAFVAVFFWGRRWLRREAFSDLRKMAMDDMLLACVFGVIFGGRLGYALFYNPAFYFGDPAQIARLWDGGMSFHGGLLGVVAALFWHARRIGALFLRVADFAAVLVPIGLFLGRIGNFINGELPGRIAPPDLPWAMIFPGDSAARHPSPLYQAILEGALLFAVLHFLASRRRRPAGFLAGAFLFGYALLRMISEMFREPDAHLGFIVGGFSMGQLLSFPMLLGGVLLLTADKWIPARRKRRAASADSAAAIPPKESATIANAAESTKNDSASERDAAAEEESEEKTELLEKYAAEKAAKTFAAPRILFWKKLFAFRREENEDEAFSRRRARREIRRQKKKRRR